MSVSCNVCSILATHLPSITDSTPSLAVAMPTPGDMSSALMASDVRIFKHEFITIFRYSHTTAIHPADIHVLEPVDERHAMYEEEKGTVFLARDVMDRLQKLTAASRPVILPYRVSRHPRARTTRVH